jgi:hypothetical protein
MDNIGYAQIDINSTDDCFHAGRVIGHTLNLCLPEYPFTEPTITAPPPLGADAYSGLQTIARRLNRVFGTAYQTESAMDLFTNPGKKITDPEYLGYVAYEVFAKYLVFTSMPHSTLISDVEQHDTSPNNPTNLFYKHFLAYAEMRQCLDGAALSFHVPAIPNMYLIAFPFMDHALRINFVSVAIQNQEWFKGLTTPRTFGIVAMLLPHIVELLSAMAGHVEEQSKAAQQEQGQQFNAKGTTRLNKLMETTLEKYLNVFTLTSMGLENHANVVQSITADMKQHGMTRQLEFFENVGYQVIDTSDKEQRTIIGRWEQSKDDEPYKPSKN